MGMLRRILALMAVAAGCSEAGGGDPRGGDAGAGDGDGGWGSAEGCAEPDRYCPQEHPQPGGPCEGSLECRYTGEEPDTSWTYRCVEDAWEPTYECPTDGCWAPPPLAEFCLDPFDGEIEGGTLEIGPESVTEPFRPFSEEEAVELVVGPQGSAMIPYRVHIGGAGSLECVALSSTLSVADRRGDTATNRLRMHCGVSLTVFGVFPFDQMLCDEGEPIVTRLHVTAEGIGETEATVRFDAPGCPNE
ncbi:MAG: hypothetical protein HYY06_31325 [Deltaproteobacteria bacterium]|nr:hypothetical protein [Deltaproteobacteria bacterium]